ncbi:MAG TPA: ABC transporter ATP-binding protein [Dehalococcoidia bacterium]|nr:ABC transporter ATP-binding protein [Dehalococcoidia bacterium]
MKKDDGKPPLICLENIRKSYTEGSVVQRVLESVDAEFAEGECVALLGRSGSGKSTLLNLISGIDKPDGGRIVIGGVDITALSEHKRTLFRRKNIGFIYQFFNIIPTLSVLENVLLPLELNGDNSKERALELLGEVGLLDRKGDYPDRLSGGEQQRIAIIRALVHDPIIILADEPTGNIDKETGRHILDIMERLIRRKNKNLILVTHSKEVATFADRLLLLEEGVLKKKGTEIVW